VNVAWRSTSKRSTRPSLLLGEAFQDHPPHSFRHGNTLEDYVYTTQLMQADCVRMAVQTWRRQFRGPGAYGCSGSLVWQLNDCWPVISCVHIRCALAGMPADAVRSGGPSSTATCGPRQPVRKALATSRENATASAQTTR
jgi:beta-galactosidase/beta-glucuronidase